jgi:hypothetical protein
VAQSDGACGACRFSASPRDNPLGIDRLRVTSVARGSSVCRVDPHDDFDTGYASLQTNHHVQQVLHARDRVRNIGACRAATGSDNVPYRMPFLSETARDERAA